MSGSAFPSNLEPAELRRGGRPQWVLAHGLTGVLHGPVPRARPAWAVALLALVFVVIPAAAEPATSTEPPAGLPDIEALQETLAQVADAVRPSVVAIRAERLPGDDDRDDPPDQARTRSRRRVLPAIGSGVVIRADGLILTNEHVIQGADLGRIECMLANGESYPVIGVTSDPRSDLAVLRIGATGLTPIRFGDVANLRQGHFAIVMGNPFGTASDNGGRPIMSFGVISALGQELTRQLDPLGERYYGNLIQTDARINPGNSGGPLINIYGELIGINTAISTRSGASEGIGYAIPMDRRIRDIVTRLARGEEVEYGYLGVDLDVPSRTDRVSAGAPARGGALIRDVRPGTAAAAGNLQAGDIIVEYDGRRVEDRDHLVRMVGASRVGEEVSVLVYREKRQLRLRVRPNRRPTEIQPVNTWGTFEWRGMRLAELSPVNRQTYGVAANVSGVMVIEVEPDGPARDAGVRPGQVLRQVGDVSLDGLRRLREIAPSLSGPLDIIVTDDADQALTLPG